MRIFSNRLFTLACSHTPAISLKGGFTAVRGAEVTSIAQRTRTAWQLEISHRLSAKQDDFCEVGYPQIATALSPIIRELVEIHTVTNSWPVPVWEKRLSAMANIARAYGDNPENIAALAFSLAQGDRLRSLLDAFAKDFGRSDAPRPMIDAVLNSTREYAASLTGWDRVLMMRENIRIAAQSLENREVARWLTASLNAGSDTIWAHDGRVVYHNDL